MNIKDSGERTEFTTGAQRDMHQGKGRFDLLPWHAIHDVAKHSEEGAIKYGERNVDKGIPQHSFIDSAFRHLVKYIHNETDEPHLRAAAWNILWALEQETTHPDLIDLPGRDEFQEELRKALNSMPKFLRARSNIPKEKPPVQRKYPPYVKYAYDMGDHIIGITADGDEVKFPKVNE